MDRRPLVGYKVVTVTPRGKKMSAFAPHAPRAIRYRIGKWARPHEGCGPIALFADLTKALEWAKCMGTGRFGRRDVYAADYLPSTCTALWDKSIHSGLSKLPNGTVLAAAVRLKELVKEGETPGSRA